MPLIFPNSYSEWRELNLRPAALRDAGSVAPPERLLQAIWHHQRIRRQQLRTFDGRSLLVLHPGFWNHEAGPDFRNAILQIDGATVTGDVEIDLHPTGWHGHGHDARPDYANVVLHVVWEGEDHNALPALSLKAVLDSPLEELRTWLGTDSASATPFLLKGQCCAPLKELSADRQSELIHQAASVRLQSKAERMLVRAKQAGWEQALIEGLFRALGYKQNIWPMQRLAELLPDMSAAAGDDDNHDVLRWQARLLGISGLLPSDLTREKASADRYLRRLWDQWWREREALGELILPRSLWRFHNLRPANHPQRRLALGAHWVAAGDLAPRIEKWFSREIDPADLLTSLQEILQPGADDFWQCHWTLSSKADPPLPLLGATRVTDLAVNVILPWLWMRAVAGKNDALKSEAESRYFSWPAAQDNAVLKLARQRLLGGARTALFKTAAAQQGLLQIVRDFCDHSNALCENCRFPALVRDFGGVIRNP